jgi:bacteriorhodopsin
VNIQLKKKKKNMKFILYLIRWQLSTPILAITMGLLAHFSTWVATVLANLIGGCIFFFVDRFIFEKMSYKQKKNNKKSKECV